MSKYHKLSKHVLKLTQGVSKDLKWSKNEQKRVKTELPSQPSESDRVEPSYQLGRFGWAGLIARSCRGRGSRQMVVVTGRRAGKHGHGQTGRGQTGGQADAGNLGG